VNVAPGWEPREYPRYRQGATRDEREWLDALDDRQLGEHCARLGEIERAVRAYRPRELPNLLALIREGRQA
jgi:hypothetical protein